MVLLDTARVTAPCSSIAISLMGTLRSPLWERCDLPYEMSTKRNIWSQTH